MSQRLIGERRVGVVQHQQAGFGHGLADFLHPAKAQIHAGRVIGVAEKDQPGSGLPDGSDGGGDVPLEAVLFPGPDPDRLRSGQRCRGFVFSEGGLEDQALLPGSEAGPGQQVDQFRGPVPHQDVGGLHAQACGKRFPEYQAVAVGIRRDPRLGHRPPDPWRRSQGVDIGTEVDDLVA